MSSDQLHRFPRLRMSDALPLAESLVASPADVRPDTRHPNQIYAPLGGPVVDESVLHRTREAVLEAVDEARAAHDSAPPGEGITWKTRFDVHVGCALHEQLPMCRSEAAAEGVWSWLTLVLLPDVVPHRHPKPTTKRLMGGLRNVFSVTWWPVEVLGRLVEPESGRALQVDEIVGLFERRTLSRDNALAVDYVTALRTLPAKDRMTTSREFAKAVRRVGAHTLWSLADHERLDGLLEKAVEKADSDPVEEPLDDSEDQTQGPIRAAVRLGSLELPFEIERSDAPLQPTGERDWTALPCPSTAGNPDALVIDGQQLDLESRGENRRGYPRFGCRARLASGVTVTATMLRRSRDVYLECKLA